jgi:hypothetical protein
MARMDYRPKHSSSASPGGIAWALGAVGRLFFAFDRPPRNLYERQFLRARAAFWFLLGVAATIAAQVALERFRR